MSLRRRSATNLKTAKTLGLEAAFAPLFSRVWQGWQARFYLVCAEPKTARELGEQWHFGDIARSQVDFRLWWEERSCSGYHPHERV
jgi:hypothetical protein